MKPEQTGELLTNIFAVSNKHVNFFLFRTNQKYIAFDAGTSEKLTLPELSKLNIKPEDITAVFLTHTDSDHVGSIGLFSNADIYISKQEEQMINGTAKRMVFVKNKLNLAYKTLADEETVEKDGLTVKCIVTPGHTKGSACYIVDNKYLFSGDNFSLKDGKVQPFIKFLNMDSREQKKSIVKIAALKNIEAAFTAHHGYTKNFTEAFENWLKIY